LTITGSLRHRLRTALFVMGMVLFVPQLWAAADASPTLRRQAEQFERRGEWARACELYEQLLSKERNLPEVRERYLHCLRRAHQARRHRDPTFLQQARDLPLSTAVEAYGELVGRLRGSYVDVAKVDYSRLFQQGVEELRLALSDPAFCQAHLTIATPRALPDFLRELQNVWAKKTPHRQQEAQAQARDLALDAQKSLGLYPTLVVLELACGACSGLDEYTVYLTLGQLSDLCASLKGEIVGVGVELTEEDQRLVIAQVIPGSPADHGGIKPGDRLHRVGPRLTAGLSAEAADELLRGEAGSPVDLEVIPLGESVPRPVRLTRQAVNLPSVSEPRFLGDRMAGVGYLQIVAFQETTPRELDDAVLKLQMAGMRGLVLDLRGNPGGLIDAAVQVAKRFLSHGVIATTYGQLRMFNHMYQARNPGALAVPLVVLIDNDTASAAEMVAGALKDHERATLVGLPTFGKGTVQRHWRLTTLTPLNAGLRITVARFYSPRGQPYSGIGVTPHQFIERPAVVLSMDLEQDPQVRAAFETARQLAMGR